MTKNDHSQTLLQRKAEGFRPPSAPAAPLNDISPLIARLAEAGAVGVAQGLAENEVPKLMGELLKRLDAAGVRTDELGKDVKAKLEQHFIDRFSAIISPKDNSRQDLSSLISRLMDLGEVEAARHLAATDVTILTKELLDRLEKAGLPREKLTPQVAENVNAFFARKYEAIINPPPRKLTRPDVSGVATKLVELSQTSAALDLVEGHVHGDADELTQKFEAAGITVDAELYEKMVSQIRSANTKLIRNALPRDIEAERRKIGARCDEIATSVLAAVDDGYAAVIQYCSKFRVDQDQNGRQLVRVAPFDTHYRDFQTAADEYEAGKPVDPEVIEAGISGNAVVSRVVKSPARIETAVGDILEVGKLRPAVVLIDSAGRGGSEIDRVGEQRVIDHSMFGIVRKDARDKISLRRFATWLRHHDVDPIPEESSEFTDFPQWAGIAALSRTALLLLEDWKSQLEKSRDQLRLPAELVADQTKRLEGTAKIDADSVIKTLAPLCKAELSKVIERQATGLAQDMLETRGRVEAAVDRVDPVVDFDEVTADRNDARNLGINRYKLKTGPLNDIAYHKIAKTVGERQALLAKAIDSAWKEYVVWKIVLNEAAIAADLKVDLANLPPVLKGIEATQLGQPLPEEVLEKVLADHKASIEGREKTEEFQYRLPKLSPRGLWDQAAKVPADIMKMFGPIAVLLVLLGLSIQQISKGFAQGAAAQNFWEVLLGLLALFMIIGWFTLVRKISHERLIQVVNVRGRILAMFDRSSSQVQRDIVEAMKAGSDRILSDYFRHIRQHIETGIVDRHRRRREQLRVLRRQKEFLNATGAGLDEAIKTLSEAADSIKSEQQNLKNLAKTQILSAHGGGRR